VTGALVGDRLLEVAEDLRAVRIGGELPGGPVEVGAERFVTGLLDGVGVAVEAGVDDLLLGYSPIRSTVARSDFQ
jgi:hypothetical protein